MNVLGRYNEYKSKKRSRQVSELGWLISLWPDLWSIMAIQVSADLPEEFWRKLYFQYARRRRLDWFPLLGSGRFLPLLSSVSLALLIAGVLVRLTITAGSQTNSLPISDVRLVIELYFILSLLATAILIRTSFSKLLRFAAYVAITAPAGIYALGAWSTLPYISNEETTAQRLYVAGAVTASTAFYIAVLFLLTRYLPGFVNADGRETYAIRLTIALLWCLGRQVAPLYAGANRTRIATLPAELRRVVASELVPATSRYSGPAKDLVQGRMASAAERLDELQSWVSLPQAESGRCLRHEILLFLAPLLSGNFHYLPSISTPADDGSRSRTKRRMIGTLVASIIPSGLLLVASLTGFVPAEWRSSLTAISAVSGILSIASFISPKSAEIFTSAKSLIGQGKE